MTWNDEIATNAQSWAEQTGGQMKHSSSSSRKGKAGFNYMGENLAWGHGVIGTKGVKMWYDEINLTPGKRGAVSGFSSGTGHYTQASGTRALHLAAERSKHS